jgi:tetratricopeptide (TPR) repeat protein
MFDDDDDWEYVPKGMSDKEFDENVDYLKNHPLFTKEAPKDVSKIPGLEALQGLLYDDEPINLARHFNKKGNEYMAKGLNKYTMKEALKSYEEGLLLEFDDDELKAKLSSNRAFLHMKYKNYGRAIEDGLKAIEYNPKFVKGYYRAATAYFALGRWEDSKKVVLKGLEVDPQCTELLEILPKCDQEIEAKALKLKEQIKEQDTKVHTLVMKMREKGIVLAKKRIHEIPKAHEHDPYFDASGILHFSTIISYPEFSQMDFIKTTTEVDLLKDHLLEIFKTDLPWDQKKHYSYDNCIALVELNCTTPLYKLDKHTNFREGFKRVNRNKPMLEILTMNGYVMPYLLEIIVVSKVSPFFDKYMSEIEIIKSI